jgi:hypothetical protein
MMWSMRVMIIIVCGLSLDDEYRLWNNHRTNTILDINCCTTLLTLVIQPVRVSLQVTLEPILEAGHITLRNLSISSCCCCISLYFLRCISSELLYEYWLDLPYGSSQIILRPTVSRPVRPGVRHTLRTHDQFFLLSWFIWGLRSRYDWRSVSQSVSKSWRRAHFGTCDQILILSEFCSLVFVGLPLWREVGSVFC